jgi:biotin-dependent carboxylase-like uncharacterized protein
MITILTAPPFATIQDLGRPGFRDVGVPVSGIADRDSGIALNALLGNAPDAAMIEWAVAGGALRFDVPATIAMGGATVIGELNGEAIEAMAPLAVSAGDELRVDRIVRGRFLLIAVRGGMDVPAVLGSRSTLVSAGIGGLGGRRLRNGDQLAIGNLATGNVQHGATTRADAGFAQPIHVMRGPQATLFDDRAWATFMNADITVSRASDRAGYRLDGVVMSHSGDASLPSEPVCVGAIQVPNAGAPIVIMNDGPTVGGYPKIAVVRTSSLSRFAQLAPGDQVRFVLDE